MPSGPTRLIQWLGARPRAVVAVGLLIAIGAGGAIYFAPGQQQPGFVTESCWFSPTIDWLEKQRDWPEAVCGRMHVPENRALAESPLISFPVVRFKAPDHAKPGGEPVLLAGGGGPGGPLGLHDDGFVHQMWQAYEDLSLKHGRDLILIDNRGVGLSRPRLNCPEAEELQTEALSEVVPLDVGIDRIRAAYEECRDRLVDDGVDLGAYNSLTAAQDIEDLRQALGIERWNLFGVSYGSRIVLTVMREFPGSVRAALLDSVVPPDIRKLEESHADYEVTFNSIIQACSNHARCRRHAPAFGKTLDQLLHELDETPLTLPIDVPNSGDDFVIIDDEALAYLLLTFFYSEVFIEFVPYAIRSMLEGDLALFTELVGVTLDEMHSLDEGAYASYACHDETPFNSLTRALEEADKYPRQRAMSVPWVRMEFAICEAWAVEAGPGIEQMPVTSDIPTLLYAGEYDPVTPPRHAEQAKKALSNAHLKIWPAIAHSVTSASDCAVKVAGRFFDEPEKDPFHLYCIVGEDKRRLEFQFYP